MKQTSYDGFIIRLSAAIVGIAAALVLFCASPLGASMEQNSAACVLGKSFAAHAAK